MGVENFTNVDIEINSRYSLFVNIEIILIFGLDPGKCLKFNQSEWRMQYPELPIRSSEILNSARHLRRELSLVGIRLEYKKRSKKSGLSRYQKRSVKRVSSFKVFRAKVATVAND